MYGGENAAPVHILEEIMMKMMKKIMMIPCHTNTMDPPTRPQKSCLARGKFAYFFLIIPIFAGELLQNNTLRIRNATCPFRQRDYSHIHLNHFVIVLLLTTEMQMRS